ncbi:MAG: formate--tetrahydrofolate ligase [Proteobacteria bacterium]|nr:formate--tetrahydrofolate ligase [Pseudomonadota bacterium]
MTAMTDLEIARSVHPRPIAEVAADLGLGPERIVPYGHDKAKIEPDPNQASRGKLVLVSAITPTPAGEGKTTTSVGLAQGLGAIGQKGCVVLREPSLGPCLGMKGGAAGGGRSQVIPMEDINLHFTGDFHAVTTAHNLLAAVIDNHLHFGNELNLEPRTVVWRRVIDMNDRALRHVVLGLGGRTMGIPREAGFDITAASEIMAILCLASDFADLERRLNRILIGQERGTGKGIYAEALGVTGAMAMLLRDAAKPNLVQTLEGTPAIIHGGPFANIAQGTNSVIATQTALGLADWVVTEAGFGFDLGAEKFLDIKCASAGLKPACVVLVATVRALRAHGSGDVTAGLPNLGRHLAAIEHFGLPAVVALNHFNEDTHDEVAAVRAFCTSHGVRMAICKGWAEGGSGAVELAEAVVEVGEASKADFKPLYDWSDPVTDKIEAVCHTIYGAQSVSYGRLAERHLKRIKRLGLEGLPVCIAKTASSLSDDPKGGGLPYDFDIHVREIEIASGAGFLIPICGDILRMPGLPRVPGATRMSVEADGTIRGLS